MIDFLRAVLPPVGPYCIAFRNKERKGMMHRAVSDFRNGIKIASWAAIKGWDVYFCISSLKDISWVDSQGKDHVRKKENCSKTKCLVLDVDIDPDNDRKYSTKEYALSAVRVFSEKLKFPSPTIVDSGYGLHVYWPMGVEIPSDKWEVLAKYFKSIAIALDTRLAADTSRIADSAGVLRLPGTRNYKNTLSPKEVKLIQLSTETLSGKDIGTKLKEAATSLGISFTAAMPTKAIAHKLDLGMDVPHRIEPILKKCNYMKQYLLNIKKTTEPQWYKILGVIKHCYHPKKSADELAHLFSKGHPGYTFDETVAKYNQVRAAQSGPSLCKTLAESGNPEWCRGCEYANIVSTPARLDEVDLPDEKPLLIESVITQPTGEKTIIASEAIPIPKPYFRGKDGGIYMHLDSGALDGDSEDTNTIRKIYEYDIYPVARLQNEDSGEEEIEVHLHLPQDGKKIIRVPNQVTIEPKGFASYLTARGVLLKPHEVTPLVSYMIDYARVIQKNSAARGVYSRFGWRDAQSDKPSFILGDGLISTDGGFSECTTANWLADQKEYASAKGDFYKWREAFDVCRLHSVKPYQFAMMLGFASPLFALTPYHGLVFNLLGQGGIGKSTALKFMTSIWGKPTMTHIIKKDNSIPIFNKIGYLNSIPVAFDEITMIPADQATDLVYSVTEGRGKERADRSGQTRVNFVKWSTIIVACSNLSLYEKIGLTKQGNAAPAYRVFETLVGPVEEKNKPVIEDAIRVLMNNYGVAGRLFMQHVVKNNRTISEELVKVEEDINRQFRLRTAERFWGGMFATVSVSMDICAQLNIHKYKKESLLTWAYDEMTNVRNNLRDSQGNALSILSDFINTNLHAVLFVSDGKINAYGISNSPARELNIRLEKTNGRFTDGYISVPAFKKYCKLNNIEYGWIVRDLIDIKALKKGSTAKRLGAGTAFGGAPISVLSLDFTCAALQEDMKIGETL